MSNNNCPKFTDDEQITVYLWGVKKQLFTRKAIYNYTKEELYSYFPDLPSYQAFCRRLNRLSEAFRALAEIWSDYACKRFSEQSCKSWTGNLQFDAKFYEKPVVSRC